MNALGRHIKRVLIIAQDRNERALIAAQLQQEAPCQVVSAANLEDGLEPLVLRTALVIVDWSNQDITPDRWSTFLGAAGRVPILILARAIDREALAKVGIEAASIVLRPFTVGDVVKRALEKLEEAKNHDGADGREQAADRANL